MRYTCNKGSAGEEGNPTNEMTYRGTEANVGNAVQVAPRGLPLWRRKTTV